MPDKEKSSAKQPPKTIQIKIRDNDFDNSKSNKSEKTSLSAVAAELISQNFVAFGLPGLLLIYPVYLFISTFVTPSNDETFTFCFVLPFFLFLFAIITIQLNGVVPSLNHLYQTIMIHILIMI